ncbi:hypothetical protein [Acinetobacter modestus]|uniref:hypothetical protein n=1 Tax=Acinetobacter modestus TaxID=1776740 RepID=UPI00320BB473
MTNSEWLKTDGKLSRSMMDKEALSKAFPDVHLYQVIDYLLKHLHRHYDVSYRISKTINPSDISYIFDTIESKNINFEDIIEDCSITLPKISEFKWIDKNNTRQLLFLYQLIKDSPLEIHYIDNNEIYNYILINYSPHLLDNIDTRIKSINELKELWEETIEIDYLNWIKIKDKTQVEWIIKYIHKLISKDIKLYSKELETNYWTALLILDIYKHEEGESHFIETINKMKKSWTQYQYRIDGKIKKPYHLPLTKQSKNYLEKLAELHNMKESKLLEVLIEKAYQEDMLDHSGKTKY